jgi:hypothetical protein
MERLRAFERQGLASLIPGVAVFGLVIFSIGLLLSILLDSLLLINTFEMSLSGAILMIMLVLLWIYIAIMLAYKAKSILVDRFFSEGICLETLFYILFTLSQDEVLTLPTKKRRFIVLVNHLVKHINLLASVYLKKTSNEKRIESRFLNITQLIEELECKAIMPTDTTINELRQEFYKIAQIFFSGNYGEFVDTQLNVIEKPSSTVQPESKNLRKMLSKFVGFVLPVLLLGTLLLMPNLASDIGIKKDAITITLLVWLLLSIDSFFELGIVSGLARLAKDIKDLS